ncbi:MAG: methionyl-tRNA formyltransferase [Parcubacteria group bacterium]|nr:methionyl-tRNA formyltransferase [Parcubacteria group bacterium]
MKYIFFGTPDFAVTILERLIEAGYVPSAIVTNPDRPVGRKHTITPPPIKQQLLRLNLNSLIFQPEKLSEIREQLAALQPDLFIVAAYGKLIPKSILEIPKHGSINVHPSLLPKYRGPTPIQTAILNGDQETGVTIMLMDEKMDHGAILKNEKSNIKNQNYGELSKELAILGAGLLIETIPKWMNGEINQEPQDDSQATYTRIYKGEDGLLDFNKIAEELDCQVRALNPEPGTYFIKDGKRIKVLKAHVENEKLILDTIQIEGKKPVSGNFLNH